ncbi:MAG: response regulator transcription factor [Desulfobacter sp.]
MRILVIEDDRTVRSYIIKGLAENGHTAEGAETGKDGLFLATTETFDAIVLDRMLPPPDGMTILRTLRATGIDTPVLVLSALGDVDDRVKGLKAGGDDYLVKPFAFSELMARLEVIARRGSTGQARETVLQAGRLEMDLLKHRVTCAGREIPLQPREFSLLEYLMRNKGQVVTRTMLLEQIWHYHFDPETNVIDVHISRLRAKIDDKNARHSAIKTVRGAGYLIGDD